MFEPGDLKIFQALSEVDNLLGLLIISFCPTIFGNELVKLGILLGIISGNETFDNNLTST